MAMHQNPVAAQGATYMYGSPAVTHIVSGGRGQPLGQVGPITSDPAAMLAFGATSIEMGTQSGNPAPCETCGSTSACSYFDDPHFDADTGSDDENKFEHEFSGVVPQYGHANATEDLAAACIHHRRRFRTFM
eukprot:3725846-Pyramimonas_sp.AAC.1